MFSTKIYIKWDSLKKKNAFGEEIKWVGFNKNFMNICADFVNVESKVNGIISSWSNTYQLKFLGSDLRKAQIKSLPYNPT